MTAKGRRSWVSLIAFLTLGLGTSIAHGGDLSWSGLYRVEGVRIDNPELDSVRRNKAYILHHLILQPKIIAADGLTIYGRLDLFNSQTNGQDSQLGQFFGNGPHAFESPLTPGSNGRDSNVLAQHENDEMINVTQLYAHWVHEFGSLVVGRVPLQFGLGITHSAGNGEFDHWFDTRDIVGYKVVLGNLFIMPMIGKMYEGALGDEDDVNDYIIHLQYDNPETDLSLGAFVEWRNATAAGNDAPLGEAGLGGAGATQTHGYKQRLINIYSTQKAGNFKIGLEGGLLSGKTGVRTAADQEVELNGYGVALDVQYRRPESKWEFGLLGGFASGDDPGTADTYEGFIFDRNYDVAMLMFNHPLGQQNILRTSLNRDTTRFPSTYVDEEAISNVFYLSPRFQNHLRDQLSWGGSLTYGILGKEPVQGGDTGNSLGFELDVNLTYKPYERMTWVTEAGFLFPGDAWKGSAGALENKFAYGIVTKAAISF